MNRVEGDNSCEMGVGWGGGGGEGGGGGVGSRLSTVVVGAKRMTSA